MNRGVVSAFTCARGCICALTCAMTAFAQAEVVRSETKIAPGVVRIALVDEAAPIRAWMIKADMNTKGLRFLHHFSNDKVYDKSIVPEHAKQISAAGRYTPIAGVNGEYFGYDKGLTQRLNVSDGRLVQTGYDPNVDAWSRSRFYESPDGTFHAGDVRFEGSLTLGGTAYAVTRMNSLRADPKAGTALFTADYAWDMPGDGILVEFAEPFAYGGNAAAKYQIFNIIGKVVKGESVAWKNPRFGAIVGFGTDAAAVASATGSGSASWGFKDGERAVDVRNLVGVWLTILKDGEIVPQTDQNETSPRGYPRTCLGYDPKKNTLVLFAADGRQKGWSFHTTSAWVAERLREEGCTYGAQFDGGGSTTLWDAKDGLVNHPSDLKGTRPVASALFIVSEK